MADLTPQGQAALRYAELGMYVFPCWWPHLGQCACGNPDCGSPAKHPLGHAVPRGVKDATVDPDIIVGWWTDYPQANVAIALGPSDLFVVDVDGPDGANTLDDLQATYFPLPDTLTADTGRAEGAGTHLFFNQPDPPIGNRKIGPKLETRGAGGYVIAYPSIHISGRPYTWRDGTYETADPPEWLVAHITRPTTGTQPAPSTFDVDDHATRRLQGAAGKVAIAEEGERNNVLNWAAYTAGQLIGAGRLDDTVARSILTFAAERAGLAAKETQQTIQSGIDAGTQHPDHDTTPAELQPLDVTTIDDDQAPTISTSQTSWAPVDGTDYIAGTWTPPAPTQLIRDDGNGLLYPGRINLLFGESEAGKGWVALHAIQQALIRGDRVLYIDFEDYPDTIYARLKLLGTPTSVLGPDRFAYIRPDNGLDPAGRVALGHTVGTLNPQLVVLDGITGAMSLHQLDTNQSTDVDQFYTLLGEPLARHGAAVVFIDHVTKSSENRGKGPIGSQHKRARVSGASYEVTSVQPIAPGRAGKLRIKIDKDRLGAIRSLHPAHAGEFHLDSTGEITVAKIYAPSGTPEGSAERKVRDMMVRLSSALEDAGDAGLSIRGINEVGGSAKDIIREAIDRLVEGGWAARSPGPNRSLLHKHAARYTGDVTVLGVPDGPGEQPVSPGRVPVSPSVPDAPGTPLAANGRPVSPVSPDVLSRGHRDTDEPTNPNTPRQVPM